VGSYGEQDSVVMTALQSSCPLLEELQLQSVSLNQQLSAGPVLFIPTNRNCKHLRKLTLFSCDVASGSAIQRIAEIESLKELKLYNCGGLSDADLAVLATMSLVDLTLRDPESSTWRSSSLQCFVGSNLSQTLEFFHLQVWRILPPIDDVEVDTALASCHNLKKLTVNWGNDIWGCVFGRDDLDGLQAMAAGCPLLTEVNFRLSPDGMYYIAEHFVNLKKCNSHLPAELHYAVSSDLKTLYPAIEWDIHYDSDVDSDGGNDDDDSYDGSYDDSYDGSYDGSDGEIDGGSEAGSDGGSGN
jgi:hypothetical protein